MWKLLLFFLIGQFKIKCSCGESNGLVYQLYGLTDDEIKGVEGDKVLKVCELE